MTKSELASIDTALGITPVVRLIRQIDFSRVRTCFLNSTQLYVIATLHDPAHCVQQVGIFRQLVLTVFHALHPTPGSA